MKISEVAIEDVKLSVGYSANDCDRLVEIYLTAAKEFIRGYTKLTEYAMDEHEDLTVALLCLAGDMFENRSMIVEQGTMNPTVKGVLALYAENHI